MRLFALVVACSIFWNACHPAPALPAAHPEPRSIGRVLFTVDVEDWTRLCLQTTQFMRFEDPNLPDVVCVETVGDLRSRAVRLRAAQ